MVATRCEAHWCVRACSNSGDAGWRPARGCGSTAAGHVIAAARSHAAGAPASHLVVVHRQRLRLRFDVLVLPPAKHVVELRVLLLALPPVLCPLHLKVIRVLTVHVVLLAEVGVGQHLVRAVQILHFHGRRPLVLVGMVLLRHVLERLFYRRGVRRLLDPQQFVVVDARRGRHAREHGQRERTQSKPPRRPPTQSAAGRTPPRACRPPAPALALHPAAIALHRSSSPSTAPLLPSRPRC